MTGPRTSLITRHCGELARVNFVGNLPSSLGSSQTAMPPLLEPIRMADGKIDPQRAGRWKSGQKGCGTTAGKRGAEVDGGTGGDCWCGSNQLEREFE